MLDGRVKTMPPKITGGILAVSGNADHMAALATHKISTIDMVVVNLYAFEKVAANPYADITELIENIDIGGPTMIRSAAKNYQDVAVVVSPSDYHGLAGGRRGAGGGAPAPTNRRRGPKSIPPSPPLSPPAHTPPPPTRNPRPPPRGARPPRR